MRHPEPEIIEVDPKRLQYGTYDHEREKDIGEGDIRGSYSADIIAMESRVRKPFKWHGELMVCVGTSGRGGVDEAQAYRLVPVRMVAGTPTTYRDKTGTSDGAEAARNDPMGFYDKIIVKSGKESYVLVGPPVIFVAEPTRPGAQSVEPAQLNLFV
jgi:hypothetical protein